MLCFLYILLVGNSYFTEINFRKLKALLNQRDGIALVHINERRP